MQIKCISSSISIVQFVDVCMRAPPCMHACRHLPACMHAGIDACMQGGGPGRASRSEHDSRSFMTTTSSCLLLLIHRLMHRQKSCIFYSCELALTSYKLTHGRLTFHSATTVIIRQCSLSLCVVQLVAVRSR